MRKLGRVTLCLWKQSVSLDFGEIEFCCVVVSRLYTESTTKVSKKRIREISLNKTTTTRLPQARCKKMIASSFIYVQRSR